MRLSDSEKRDLIKLIENGKDLPERYRFLLFDQNKQLELLWNGKDEYLTDLVLPFQIIEQIDEPRSENVDIEQYAFDFDRGSRQFQWVNKLIWGDNKYILASLKNGPMRQEIENLGGIKMIYIDPPFDIQADFSYDMQIGGGSFTKRPNILEQFAYADTWGRGPDSFLCMIYERLRLLKDLLADNGSIFVHCDYRLSGKMRLVLDEVFGNLSFTNEIIWQGTAGDSSNKNKKFIKSHDSIFYYRKNPNNFIWNESFQEMAEGALKLYKNEDLNGKFTWDNSSNPGKTGYIYDLGYGEKMPRNGYRMPKETAEEWIKIGKLKVEAGNVPRIKRYLNTQGVRAKDVWTDIRSLQGNENLGYPTQKPEKLLERIILCASNPGDLIFDCFAGSGTTPAVAEKLNRRWICSDIGKFSVHTIRKRLINIQRELKSKKNDWTPFQVLNLGKYYRQHFIYGDFTVENEKKTPEKNNNEKEFVNLILEAYKADQVSGFKTIHAKKNNVFVSLGPFNQPLSRTHVEEVIKECNLNNIVSVDILAFEYEMGLFPSIQEEAKNKGLRLTYKQIPSDIFDQKAIKNNIIIFHEVAYIEFTPSINENKVSVELKDFKVFFNENNLNKEKNLISGRSKIIIDNGQIIKVSKDLDGNIVEENLIKHWSDWIDYWSVDFDYESKKELIQLFNDKGEVHNAWTGKYIFENEWQSFRDPKNNLSLQFKTPEYELEKGSYKVAVKIVDIFGNDTMKICEVKV